jgi:hypothetical protein
MKPGVTMKKLPLIIVFIFCVQLCIGQKINKAEYFIDSDPGFGLATQIPVSTPSKDVSLSFQVNSSGLTQGFHMMVLRAHDDKGLWSTTRQQSFYVYRPESTTEYKITKAEYFIDTDPGFGKAISVPIGTPAKKLSLSYNVNITGLSQGFHMMVMRARDEIGHWSATRQQTFYVYSPASTTSAKINKAEYFIDTDPGFGKATEIPVSTPSKLLSLNFNPNITGLAQGFHMLVVRARDEMKKWSNTRQQVFYVYRGSPTIAPKITGLEYFIDNDPGFDKGTKVTVPVPADRVELEFTVSLTGLSSGNHILYMRARDAADRWSNLYIHAFTLTVTAIGDEIVPWFKMYPNPSEGNFVIDFDDLQRGSVKITITDLNGRNVYSNELNGELIPLSVDLPDGIYMLRAESGTQHFMQKLIIRR